jgi:hypothetical protein
MLALGIKGVGSAGIEIGVAEIEGAGVEKVFGRNSLSPSVLPLPGAPGNRAIVALRKIALVRRT